jgi:hypothetical protein
VQALKPDDKPRRFEFAKDILSKVKANESYFRRWIFSYEATFYISGNVNCHNCKICGSQNPHAIREIKKDSAKLMRAFVMFRRFGALHLCGTNSESDKLSGHAVVVSVTPAGIPARWCTPTLGLYCPTIS